MKQNSVLAIGVVAVCLLIASILGALFIGSADIPIREIVGSVLQGPDGPHSSTSTIVWMLRIPRVLLATVVGGGLAMIGVAMQALVRNPLADPYILGISSGAAAGASLFYLGFLPPVLAASLSMPLAAFIGGLITITAVFAVAHSDGSVSVAKLLLAGVALSALMSSIASFVTFSSPDPNKMKGVLFWLLGSFSGASWGSLTLPFIAVVLCATIMMLMARPLDTLLLGEEAAQSLGVNIEQLKRVLFVVCALVTGFMVAAAGTIGFVGLIVPHAVRSIAGISHRRVIPLSFVVGAIFMIWADVLSTTLLRPVEFPVGVVTAFAGVPFFLVILRASRYQFG